MRGWRRGAGVRVGPAFRGLRAAWRRGGEVFAEVALPGEAAADAGGYGVHPALLDAVLHAAAVAGADGQGGIMIPFSWGGVSVHAGGASVLRARLTRDSGSWVLAATDGAGVPAVSVGSLVLRAAGAGELGAAGGGVGEALFEVEWVPVPVPVAGAGRWAVAGGDVFGVGAGLAAAGAQVAGYADVAGLAAAVAAGGAVPDAVLMCAGTGTEPGAGGERACW